MSNQSTPVPASAVAVLGRTGLVWVEGADTVSFLDGLLSQNIARLETGQIARSLLLAPNGKMRAPLFVLRGDDRVGLVCDASVAETVAGDLRRFKIRVDVTISIDERDIWEIWGDADLTLLPSPDSWTEDETSLRFEMPFTRSDEKRLVIIGLQPDVPVVESDSLEARRIELGEPVMGVDLTDKTIPQEAGDVTNSVDFDKGCYLGQELVARIDSRGHVNRHLAGVLVEGDTVPKPGTEIRHQDAVVGTLTSTSWSDRFDRPVAMGMVRVEVAAGTQVDVDGQPGRVVDLPIVL